MNLVGRMVGSGEFITHGLLEGACRSGLAAGRACLFIRAPLT